MHWTADCRAAAGGHRSGGQRHRWLVDHLPQVGQRHDVGHVLNHDGTRASSHEQQLQADNSTVVTTDTSWTYDALQRLAGEAVTSTATGQSYSDVFAYDVQSNRTGKAHTGPGGGADETTAYTYNGNDERVRSTNHTFMPVA